MSVLNTRERRGFTMIELMTAIALAATIIGLALPTYLDSQNKARRAEAPSNVEGILTAMTAFRVVNDAGVTAPGGGAGTAWNPAYGYEDLGKKQRQWQTGSEAWDTLGYQPDGLVRCNYLMADSAWTSPTLGDLYHAGAYCDVDGDGYYFGYYDFSPKSYDLFLSLGYIDGDPYLVNPEYY